VAEHRVKTTTELLGLVERPVRWKVHAGCGRRLGETGWSQGQYRAPGRPHLGRVEVKDLHLGAVAAAR